MLTQSIRQRLGRALELAVERGLAGSEGTGPQTLERDLEAVLARGRDQSEESVALALGVAVALSLGERPGP